MTQAHSGAFHCVRMVGARREALSRWRVTTTSARVAVRVYALFGGPDAGECAQGGGWEVDTSAASVPVVLVDVDDAGFSFRLVEADGLGAFRLGDAGLARSWVDGGRAVSGGPVCELSIGLFEFTTRTGTVVMFRKPVLTLATP